MIEKAQKLPELEGLRAVAAIVVLLSHLRDTFFPGDWYSTKIESLIGWVGASVFESFFDGNFSVWLFWVMSAFVLSIRFYSSGTQTEGVRLMSDAAIRRYPRLAIPVLFSVVLTWVIYNLGWMSNRELAVALGQSDQSWLHKLTPFSGDLFQALKSAIWTVFFSYDESRSYNPVLWTMQIELLGSFFLFCFLCLFGKSEKRWVFYAAVLFVCSALSLYWIDAFILGALLCDLYVTKPTFAKSETVKRATHRIFNALSHPVASVILFVPTLAMIGLPSYQGVFHLLIATALTGFVVVNDLSRRIFSSRILIFLGKISFGFYLGHPLVIAVLGNPIFAFLVRYCSPTLAALVSCLLLGFCSIGFGWMIWRLADYPAVNLSKRLAKMLQ